MTFLKKHRFLLFIFAFLLYCAILIFRTSFLVHGQRYFVLFDDEMISMRYAHHLAQGLGPVWNSGEHIEGFSNPLWMLYMSLFHLFPLSNSAISLLIQISCVGIMVINVVVVKKIVGLLTTNKFILGVSLFLIAGYYPLQKWTILGTEVSIATLLVSLSVYCAVHSLKTKSFSGFLFVLLGLLTLVRLDLVIPTILISGYVFWQGKTLRRQILVIGLPIVLLFLFVQEGIRVWYYHDFFPNTYYLKIVGYPLLLRITRGLYVTGQFLLGINWLVAGGALVLSIQKKNRPFLLLSLLFLGQIFYSIYTGGDVWEQYGGSNRFITPVMPLFFILVALLASQFSKKVVALLMIAYLVSINFVNSDMFFEWTLLKKTDTIGGNEYNVKRALVLNTITDAQAKIAVFWAGTTPYFSERYYIDLLGKNDVYIAHKTSFINPDMTVTQKMLHFIPGHTKWDFAYSIKQVHPDVIAEPKLYEDGAQYMGDYKKITIDGISLFVDPKSTHVHVPAGIME